MIKHIVMWRFLDEAEGHSKEENMKKAKKQLEALAAKLPIIKKMEIGIDQNKSAAAFDMVLYSEFDSLKELDEYQVNPEHREISAFISKVRTDRAVVDYVV